MHLLALAAGVSDHRKNIYLCKKRIEHGHPQCSGCLWVETFNVKNAQHTWYGMPPIVMDFGGFPGCQIHQFVMGILKPRGAKRHEGSKNPLLHLVAHAHV